MFGKTEEGKGNELEKIAGNSVINATARIFSKAVSLIVSMVIARTVGVEGTGQYAIAITYAGILYVFLNFGIFSIVQRETAKEVAKASEYLSKSLGLLIFVSVPAAVFIGVGLKYVLRLNTGIILMVFACIYCGLTGIFTLVSNVCEGLDRFDVECKATVIYNAVTLVVAFPVLILGKKIEYLLVMNVGIFLVTDIVLLLWINKKLCPVRISFSKAFNRSLLKMSCPLILSSASEYVNLKADTMILGYDKGEFDTGIYSTAVNIYQGISSVPQAVASAFMPSFTRTYAKDKKEGKKLFAKSFGLFFVFLLLLSAGMIACRKWLVVVLYGSEFLEASSALAVLGVAILPMEANRFFNNALIAMGKQKIVGISIFVGSVFNVTTNLIFIPVYSYQAAAYTTLATECIVAIIGLLFILRDFCKKEGNKAA